MIGLSRLSWPRRESPAATADSVSLLLLYIALAVSVSFLCSLMEATLLSSRNSTLIDQQHHGNRGAARLLHLKVQRVDDAISAILTLTTVANTLGATLAGAQAARIFGSTWVGDFSGLMALLILAVSEIIPKTLGAMYWRQLSGFVGSTLHHLTLAMSPALVLSRVLTRLLTPNKASTLARRELAATIATAARDGVITSGESRNFENLLRCEEVRVEDVMTP